MIVYGKTDKEFVDSLPTYEDKLSPHNRLANALFDRLRNEERENGSKYDDKGNRVFKDGIRLDKKDYQFIPLDANKLERSLRFAYHHHTKQHNVYDKPRLYDVGSGLGNVLFYAKNIMGLHGSYNVEGKHRWNSVIGIEKYPRKGVFHLIEPTIIKDIFDLTKDDFRSNSIVYLYNPIADTPTMQNALLHLCRVVSDHTTICFVKASNAGFTKPKGTIHYAEVVKRQPIDLDRNGTLFILDSTIECLYFKD